MLLVLLALHCVGCGGDNQSSPAAAAPAPQENAAGHDASDGAAAALLYAARVAAAFSPIPHQPPEVRVDKELSEIESTYGFRYQLEGPCKIGGSWLAHGEGVRDPVSGSLRLLGVLELSECDGRGGIISTDLLVYAAEEDEVFFHAALEYSMTAFFDDFDEVCTLHWMPLQFDGPLAAFFSMEERDEALTSGTAALDCIETDFVCVLEPDTFSDFGDSLSDCVDDHL